MLIIWYANNLVFFLKPGCCGVPIPAGAFFSPKKCVFILKPGCCGVPIPAGAFFSPKKCVFILKPGCCGVPIPAGAFFSPKKHRPRVFPEAKVAFRVDETLVWHTPGNPADPPDWCHQVPLRPSLPHAPGVRMTAVITNSLKLYCP